MIQIRLQNETPDLAIYAQHATAETRRWSQVDLVPGTQRPLVYVARGSHASYFEPGRRWTGHWFDYADGKRRARTSRSTSSSRTMRIGGGSGGQASGATRRRATTRSTPAVRTGRAGRDQWDDPLVMVQKAAEQGRATAGASGRGRPPRRSCASNGPAAQSASPTRCSRDPTAGSRAAWRSRSTRPKRPRRRRRRRSRVFDAYRQCRPDHAGRSGQVRRTSTSAARRLPAWRRRACASISTPLSDRPRHSGRTDNASRDVSSTGPKTLRAGADTLSPHEARDRDCAAREGQ